MLGKYYKTNTKGLLSKRIKKKIRYTQSESDKEPNTDEEAKSPKEPSRSQITVPRNPLYDLNFEEERVW